MCFFCFPVLQFPQQSSQPLLFGLLPRLHDLRHVLPEGIVQRLTHVGAVRDDVQDVAVDVVIQQPDRLLPVVVHGEGGAEGGEGLHAGVAVLDNVVVQRAERTLARNEAVVMRKDDVVAQVVSLQIRGDLELQPDPQLCQHRGEARDDSQSYIAGTHHRCVGRYVQ